MTRINVGVEPRELPDRLLMAETQEILRIPRMVRQMVRTKRRRVVVMPTRFRLGAGHVTFFFRRLGYLRTRYIKLLAECGRRGFKVHDQSEEFDGLPASVMGDYRECPHDRQIIVDRIYGKGFELLTQKRSEMV